MCTDKIRLTNPSRIILYAPKKISNPEYLTDLRIPESAGDYAMVEWHFYAAGPDSSALLPNGHPNPKKWTTGTAEEKKFLTDKINLAVNWQNEHNIPTWVGAWMAGNYNKGNYYSIEEQIVFAEFMIQSLETENIPWCINAIHKFYDEVSNQWIDSMVPLLNVIAPKEVTPVTEPVLSKKLKMNLFSINNGVVTSSNNDIILLSVQGRYLEKSFQRMTLPKLKGVFFLKIGKGSTAHFHRIVL